MCHSNNGFCYSAQHVQYVLLFLVLAVNSNQSRVTRSYSRCPFFIHLHFKIILVLFLMSFCFHHVVTGVINEQDNAVSWGKQLEQRFVRHCITWDNACRQERIKLE